MDTSGCALITPGIHASPFIRFKSYLSVRHLDAHNKGKILLFELLFQEDTVLFGGGSMYVFVYPPLVSFVATTTGSTTSDAYAHLIYNPKIKIMVTFSDFYKRM